MADGNIQHIVHHHTMSFPTVRPLQRGLGKFALLLFITIGSVFASVTAYLIRP